MNRALVCVGVAWLGAINAGAGQVKPSHSVWDGVYTEQQALRGRSEYMQSCASCHAEDLRGKSTAPSLVEESFAFQWDDLSVGELFTKIRTLMPSDRPGSLSRQSYVDIVAFILQKNALPSGEKELGTDADTLNQILITAKRPESPR
jgi:cytochrome c